MMRIVKASFEILSHVDGDEILRHIEAAGRTCYKSEAAITAESAVGFVKRAIARGHESIIEHASVSVRIVCDRGVSHEIVRHRLTSISMESTRYCDYGKAEHVTFIRPCFFPGIPLGETTQADRADVMPLAEFIWVNQMLSAEDAYKLLLSQGCSPQEARSVLPNSLKTELVMTANLREWRHFFRLRAAGEAGMPHPQMLEIAVPMLQVFKSMVPVVFDDIQPIGLQA